MCGIVDRRIVELRLGKKLELAIVIIEDEDSSFKVLEGREPKRGGRRLITLENAK